MVLSVLALVALAGCSPAEPVANVESGAKKVAVFEGGEVIQAEVQEQIDLFARQSGGGEVPEGSPQYEALISQVMPQLVAVAVAEAYVEENDITVSEEDVDRQIAELKEQVGGQVAAQAEAAGQEISPEEGFQHALQQAGMTEQELREQVRETLPLQKVQEDVAGDAEPSREEIRSYYEENRELQFTTPEQRCARHILFSPDQEQQAEEVKRRLEGGADFAELAREFSQDPGSKEQGGDLGCLGRGETVPEFEEALFDAEEGEIVGPVETEFGFHVIEVTETRPEEAQPLEEVEQQIREQLTAQRQAEEFEAWIQDQIEERNVRYLPGYEPTPPAPEAPPEGGAPAEGPEEQPER
jgi:peptidyl-prolyl cis-trans isomerase C